MQCHTQKTYRVSYVRAAQTMSIMLIPVRLIVAKIPAVLPTAVNAVRIRTKMVHLQTTARSMNRLNKFN